MKSQAIETYEILRDKILSGEFRPTQRLTEAKLVKELGLVAIIYAWLSNDWYRMV